MVTRMSGNCLTKKAGEPNADLGDRKATREKQPHVSSSPQKLRSSAGSQAQAWAEDNHKVLRKAQDPNTNPAKSLRNS